MWAQNHGGGGSALILYTYILKDFIVCRHRSFDLWTKQYAHSSDQGLNSKSSELESTRLSPVSQQDIIGSPWSLNESRTI